MEAVGTQRARESIRAEWGARGVRGARRTRGARRSDGRATVLHINFIILLFFTKKKEEKINKLVARRRSRGAFVARRSRRLRTGSRRSFGKIYIYLRGVATTNDGGELPV